MITPFTRIALALSAAPVLSIVVIWNLADTATACDVGCMPRGVAAVYYPVASTPIVVDEPKLSWVFRRSTFTNDPLTGARVAQYARKDPVEPLDDQRLVTSSYRRMRSVNRGRDGSMDSTYVVQGWGTGGGELGAEWQMFNDVWKEAILSGSFFNNEQAAGPWGGNRWGGGNNWNGGNPNWGGNGWGGGWGPGGGGGWPNNGWPWNGGNGGGWNGGGGGPSNHWNHGGRPGRDDHWPSDNRMPLPVPN